MCHIPLSGISVELKVFLLQMQPVARKQKALTNYFMYSRDNQSYLKILLVQRVAGHNDLECPKFGLYLPAFSCVYVFLPLSDHAFISECHQNMRFFI